MNYVQIAILGVIQGLAELLPISSSAHVIVAEKLMGLDPGAPEMTFLLVMLHTGTMFAVIAYFWPRWQPLLFGRRPGTGGEQRLAFLKGVIVATALTGVVGLGLKAFIEHVILRGQEKAEIEQLFRNLPLMGCSLLAAGILIIIAGRANAKAASNAPVGGPNGSGGAPNATASGPLTMKSSLVIGVVQGLCLPFRGFSRSGATISVGLLRHLPRDLAETFSFALAVVLTPPVIVLETHRLIKATAATGGVSQLSAGLFLPGAFGMVCALAAGLGALRWLSKWLEHGRWHYFGYYCVAASIGVFTLAALG